MSVADMWLNLLNQLDAICEDSLWNLPDRMESDQEMSEVIGIQPAEVVGGAPFDSLL